jgi:hypothetical protein
VISVEVKGLSQLQKALGAEQRKRNKALENAIRIEGFRLRKALGQEIRAGAPGGQRFAPLSFIAKKWGRKTARRDNSLAQRSDPFGTGKKYSLADAIRYGVSKQSPYEFKIGWTNDFLTKTYQLSKSWINIARKHQAGFTRPITEKQRKSLVHQGSELGKRSKYRKYFFIKKSTAKFTTPKREIMVPFWREQRGSVMDHIRSNYIEQLRKNNG